MSSRFGYWNPYRRKPRGYVIRKDPNAVPYRQLRLADIKTISKQLNLEPEALPDPFFPSNYFESFTYVEDLGDGTPRTRLFSSLSPISPSAQQHWSIQLPYGPSTISSTSRNLYLVYLVRDTNGYCYFFSLILHMIYNHYPGITSPHTFELYVSCSGIDPGSTLYLLCTTLSDPQVPSAAVPSSSFSPAISINHDNERIVMESLGITYHKQNIPSNNGETSTTYTYEFSLYGSSPKYPFLKLPERTIIFE